MLVGVAAIGHSAAWLYVTSQLLEGLPGFVAAAAHEGWRIQSGRVERAGWPFEARLRVSAVLARRELGGPALQWSAERVDVVISPHAPGMLSIEPVGAGSVVVGDAPAIPVRAGRAALAVRLDGAGPATLALRDLVVGTAMRGVKADRVDAGIDAGVAAGTIEGIALAPPLPRPFEQAARASGRVVVAPPLPEASTPGQSARAWQAAGGRIDVPELVLDWGRLHVEGAAQGHLDAQLQPALEASLRVRGATEVLEAAVQAGVVAPGPATAARAVLGLLTMAAAGGPVTFPVSVRDRSLVVAQFVLARLPELDWGQ